MLEMKVLNGRVATAAEKQQAGFGSRAEIETPPDEQALMGPTAQRAKELVGRLRQGAPAVELVSLKGNDHLLLRLIYENGDSVVAKRFEAAAYRNPRELDGDEMLGSDNYRHATLDFLREAQALEILNASIGVASPYGQDFDAPLAPDFFGSDLAKGILVMGDLNTLGGRPLYSFLGIKFKGQGGEKAPPAYKGADLFLLGNAFARIGEAFAHLHNPQRVRHVLAHTEASGMLWLRELSRFHDADLFSNSRAALEQVMNGFGTQTPPGLDKDLDTINDAVLNPREWLALTHGDVCPDNIFLLRRQERADNGMLQVEPMLIDYSSAGLRHALADLSAVVMLFPTCWCAGDLPRPFIERMLERYRHTLLHTVTNLEGTYRQSTQLRRLRQALSDRARFDRALLQMTGFHLVVVIAEYWDDANENRECFQTSCRSHIMSRLSTFLHLSAEHGHRDLPHLAAAMETLYVRLREAWLEREGPHVLAPFPAFRRLAGAFKEAAALDATRRLQQVTQVEALDWLASGNKHLGVEEVSDHILGKASLQSLLRARDAPLKLTGEFLQTKWPALQRWRSLREVAGRASPDASWVIKKTGKLLRQGRQVSRFPIGCCTVSRLEAGRVARGEGLEDGAYYASILLAQDGQAQPGASGLLDDVPGFESFVVGGRDQAPIVNLWSASAGSVTPVHYDPFHNTFVQVAGTKRFLLFPPAAAPALYLHPRLHLRHRQAQVNLNDVDLERFPRAQELEAPLVVTVGPGDVLYLPPYWFHQVESLNDTVSVSLFTQSVELELQSRGWDVMLPLLQSAEPQSTEAATSMLALFLLGVAMEVFPHREPREVFRELFDTRYGADLFRDVLSAQLHAHGPMHAEDNADPHYARFMHEAQNAAPGCLLGASDEDCKARLPQFCQTDAALRARLAKNPALGSAVASTSATLRQLGVNAISFGNLAEDLISAAVGEAQVFAFAAAARGALPRSLSTVIPAHAERPSVGMFGICDSRGSSWVQGAELAPPALREALCAPSSNGFAERGALAVPPDGFFDLGDLTDPPDEVVELFLHQILDKQLFPLVLGGDHAITRPVLKALHSFRQNSSAASRPLVVLQFDAHADLYEDLDTPFRSPPDPELSHAAQMSRILEHGYCDQLVQVGVRCNTVQNRRQIQRFGVDCIEMHQVAAQGRDIAAQISAAVEAKLGSGYRAEADVFVTLDLDCLDPAFAPGVAHPEPGGLTVRQVVDTLHFLDCGQFVGADVVELNPPRDVADNLTARTGAKLLKELLARVARQQTP
ncbi:Arginase 1 [Durusdinium trenchii]|uniref:Mitochondrial (Arginine amidohydrolase 1) n=1 Tax=Durusdinium trenchii TaxID=1381693 RepID=A0ABP0RTI9_9DINO